MSSSSSSSSSPSSPSSELRRTHARFADDNPLLFLSLGLLSSFEKLDRILQEHAAAANEADRTTLPPAESSNDLHGVEFVLGLLAVRARLERHLDTIERNPAAAAHVTANTTAAEHPRSDSFYR